MNRQGIFIMLVIAFALFWQTNHGTDNIPESFTPNDDNVHNFFDSLKDTMDQAGYTPAQFLEAARATLEAFNKGSSFNKFTVYTDQGYRQAYDFVQNTVSTNPTKEVVEIPSREIFSGLMRFIQTCFASFSEMNPLEQLNAFLQLFGFYVCLNKLYTGVTKICTRLYNFGKLTVSTFKSVYTFLTNNDPTNANNIPINISIPSIASQTVPQSASPTMKKVKEKIDTVIASKGGQIDENTTLEEIMIIEGSMSADDAQKLAVNTPGLNMMHFNTMNRTASLPTVLPSSYENSVFNFSVNNNKRSNSSSDADYFPQKMQPKMQPKNIDNKKGYHYTPYPKPSPKSGGRSKSKRTKKRKQNTKRRTKRRKSTIRKYKRRQASSRKR